jgi:hypothetical protein
MRLGGGIGSVAATRAARAASGRTQGNALAVIAADANKDAPATNVEETPTVPENPMTGGDGAVIDEGAVDGPFVTDDDSILEAEPEGPV